MSQVKEGVGVKDFGFKSRFHNPEPGLVAVPMLQHGLGVLGLRSTKPLTTLVAYPGLCLDSIEEYVKASAAGEEKQACD